VIRWADGPTVPLGKGATRESGERLAREALVAHEVGHDLLDQALRETGKSGLVTRDTRYTSGHPLIPDWKFAGYHRIEAEASRLGAEIKGLTPVQRASLLEDARKMDWRANQLENLLPVPPPK